MCSLTVDAQCYHKHLTKQLRRCNKAHILAIQQGSFQDTYLLKTYTRDWACAVCDLFAVQEHWSESAVSRPPLRSCRCLKTCPKACRRWSVCIFLVLLNFQCLKGFWNHGSKYTQSYVLLFQRRDKTQSARHKGEAEGQVQGPMQLRINLRNLSVVF